MKYEAEQNSKDEKVVELSRRALNVKSMLPMLSEAVGAGWAPDNEGDDGHDTSDKTAIVV